MEQFVSPKELSKDYEIGINIQNLKKKMMAKNSEEMRTILISEKKQAETVKENFEKAEKGEIIEEKLIKGSFKQNWIYRAALIQKDIYSDEFAYKEKDEEYNIW